MRLRDTDKEALVKQKAIQLLVQQGFEGFSMNKLAKASGVSVATLYIYYNDKDDLIKKIGVEIVNAFFEAATKNFSPEMPFAEGLRLQWENRIAFTLNNLQQMECWEVIRHSPHGEYVLQNSVGDFKQMMGDFCKNAIKNGQLTQLPLEVFWSIAYGPLYTLLRFHAQGENMGGSPFVFSEEIKERAFETVIKALTP
ncbi:TetR/AcrR family transcriptional regulator [Flavobacterium rhizosphaerae]|uniref:TetR/AcrR family transcriptional regulator n=1 Tax=Flavobacterium rhizosphaerae TaxID=3163298 RepID=A0ABW8Z246_9FLAO